MKMEDIHILRPTTVTTDPLGCIVDDWMPGDYPIYPSSNQFNFNWINKIGKILPIILNDSFEYRVEIAGFDKSEIVIEERRGTVVIFGTSQKFQKNCHETIILPDDADPKTLVAEYHNGMLVLRCSKKVEKARNIKIK